MQSRVKPVYDTMVCTWPTEGHIQVVCHTSFLTWPLKVVYRACRDEHMENLGFQILKQAYQCNSITLTLLEVNNLQETFLIQIYLIESQE